jgi:hypothetical protein
VVLYVKEILSQPKISPPSATLIYDAIGADKPTSNRGQEKSIPHVEQNGKSA